MDDAIEQAAAMVQRCILATPAPASAARAVLEGLLAAGWTPPGWRTPASPAQLELQGDPGATLPGRDARASSADRPADSADTSPNSANTGRIAEDRAPRELPASSSEANIAPEPASSSRATSRAYAGLTDTDLAALPSSELALRCPNCGTGLREAGRAFCRDCGQSGPR